MGIGSEVEEIADASKAAHEAEAALKEDYKAARDVKITESTSKGVSDALKVGSKDVKLTEEELSKISKAPIELKKEMTQMQKEMDKLESVLGGIKNMKSYPAAVFIVDPNREHIAVKEAKKLKVPLVAIVDTNCNPENIDFESSCKLSSVHLLSINN